MHIKWKKKSSTFPTVSPFIFSVKSSEVFLNLLHFLAAVWLGGLRRHMGFTSRTIKKKRTSLAKAFNRVAARLGTKAAGQAGHF